MCSWESRQPPKLSDRVRILAFVLMPVWLDTERRRTRNAVHVGATPTAGSFQLGAGSAELGMRSNAPSSALPAPNSTSPRSVPERIRPCEGRGPGSIPGGDTDGSSELGAGSAERKISSALPAPSSELERRWSRTVRRLPAKQLQVGSTPTGVFQVISNWPA
jgi:hypothetical protein